jgi:hypothetical protein
VHRKYTQKNTCDEVHLHYVGSMPHVKKIILNLLTPDVASKISAPRNTPTQMVHNIDIQDQNYFIKLRIPTNAQTTFYPL